MGFLPQRGLKFWKTPLKIPSVVSEPRFMIKPLNSNLFLLANMIICFIVLNMIQSLCIYCFVSPFILFKIRFDLYLRYAIRIVFLSRTKFCGFVIYMNMHVLPFEYDQLCLVVICFRWVQKIGIRCSQYLLETNKTNIVLVFMVY